jgi:hypothetical protein
MSSNKAASPAKAIAATRKKGPMFGFGRACVSGMTINDTPWFVAGYSRANAAAFTSSVARACDSDTPGCSRPSTHIW